MTLYYEYRQLGVYTSPYPELDRKPYAEKH
jgi:hypothetical protein